MTTEVRRQARSAAQATDGQQPADALVVFGITGDLAKVMTFTSLYRLERRGPLDRPIVGGAGDDRASRSTTGRPTSFATTPGSRSPRAARTWTRTSSSASRTACPTWRATSGTR